MKSISKALVYVFLFLGLLTTVAAISACGAPSGTVDYDDDDDDTSTRRKKRPKKRTMQQFTLSGVVAIHPDGSWTIL
ncbi:MAG: hypothetical protein PVI21_04705 [Candidatus Woesebacteria bacterium]|jgi:hypothetical protein